MQIHGRAKLGPAGRPALCQAIENGMTFRQAAARLNVSPATAHRWWRRYAHASWAERHSFAWAADRSSRPHRSPRLLEAGEQEQICEGRRHTGWGPRLVGGRTGHSNSTVWRCSTAMACCGVRERPVMLPDAMSGRVPRTCCTWTRPAMHALSALDIAVTGDRSTTRARMLKPVGYDFAHAIVDDHSRLAYVELHTDERAPTITAFVERALAWFDHHGIQGKRLMTDNAWSYTHNRSLRELLAAREIKHITTKPYRPQTNGKFERFHQTMGREWAYGMSYRSHRHCNRALPHWLEHYNTRRPHSGIGNRPSVSRVHNLRGQDS